MASIIQRKTAILIRCCAPVSGSIKPDRWKRKQRRFILGKKITDHLVFVVVFPPHVLVTCGQKVLVFGFQVLELGNRHQLVAPEVSYLGFDIAFFVAGIRIHEHCLETVMLTEPAEPVGDLAPATLDDPGNNGACIIEPDF